MSRADLHVHSRFSEQLSEEFLRKLGALESYTEPEFIYAMAKERGMDFVTITDHNRIDGALRLHENHPDDTFTGVESTVYFPEDGCNVHILVFGLTADQFAEIQQRRSDIYAFRNYLKATGLAHAVAHATYSRNKKMDVDKLEKLILLFDSFEGINGGSSRLNNDTWMRVLRSLTPEKIEELHRKHGIEPFGETPWIKGITGGSDDHAGLFIGRTFTHSKAANVAEFVETLRKKETGAGGKHSDFRSMVFTLYKIACDFSKTKERRARRSVFQRVNELIFENKPLGFRDKLGLKTLKYRSRRKEDRIQNLLIRFVEDFDATTGLPVDRKLDLIYERMAGIGDEYLKNLLDSVSHDLHVGDISGLFKVISSSVAGALLSMPFLATFSYMHRSRELTCALEKRFPGGREPAPRRILWFTDSIRDLEGNSSSVENLRLASRIGGENLKIAASCVTGSPEDKLPGVLNLAPTCTFRPPFYDDHVYNIPSLLTSLEEICRYEPDEIYVSSLGPLGLLGLLAAKLLGIKCVGIYNAQYCRDTRELITTRSVSNLLESYHVWFYSKMDELKVLTPEHLDVLVGMGLKRSKISIFDKNSPTAREFLNGVKQQMDN